MNKRLRKFKRKLGLYSGILQRLSCEAWAREKHIEHANSSSNRKLGLYGMQLLEVVFDIAVRPLPNLIKGLGLTVQND